MATKGHRMTHSDVGDFMMVTGYDFGGRIIMLMTF